MSSVFEFVAEARKKPGTASAKSVRRQGKVPAVIYGGEADPEMLVLDHNEVVKHLAHEAVYSHILDVVVAGKAEKAILKAVQRHPAKARVLHLDFLRVTANEKLKAQVPLHFINEDVCVGAKLGGVVMHNLVDIEVACLPEDLPEYIEVDLSSLNLGETLHVSQLAAPKGVEFLALSHGDDHDADVSVVTVVPPRVEKGETSAEAEE
ncbi:50S ribosomal protein L25/general stress protein Ctc [Methylotuvimicrobium buryatense]|uniref:Large ribosomal subunit protein bL25 n=1 Tax=Methylotuvimicrobium buryatense TaxID=95641 RepID=A0A4P9UK37_METBY|nr:50S ribosomal protein L25/general stress protein Ctc [Methylotuvimicrobium buryatense]QCW81468.1 50S ribosomal protein L25/general stress protein Ctc [Methylotuvimicrobium buryatense]